MTGIHLLASFTRLSLHQSSRCFSTAPQLYFKASPCLFAEPLKKKKRIDPQVLKQREDRRRKKIEKQIRRLEKHARQMKPIDELEVPLNLLDEKEQRKRDTPPLTSEEIERRALLEKTWARSRALVHLRDVQMYDRIIISQQRALDELRSESEELYQEAIQPDQGLLPFKAAGPVVTPPISDYESPDGEYIDVSRKWD